MKVLIASNGYPTSENPTRQTFVKKIFNEFKNKLGENNVGLIFNKYYSFFHIEQGEKDVSKKIMKMLFLMFSYLPFIIIHSRKYDVLYSHGVLMSATLMVFASKLHNIKHVCYVHGGDVNTYSLTNGIFYKIIYKCLSTCDLVITNSHYMQDVLSKHYNIKSIVITPGYDDDLFYFQPQKKSTDILFAGNAIKRKGIDVLIDAIKENKKYYKNKNVKIYCEGALKQYYFNQVKEYELLDIITFGDRLNADDLAKEYNKSKVFVFPSRKEPLGLVGIEAIASGAILVATNTGGIKEYVRDGYNGYLFERENYNDLHEKISFVLDNYYRLEEDLEEIAYSVKDYSVESGVNETLGFLNQLINLDKVK